MWNPVVFALSENLGGAFSTERWAYAGKMALMGMVMIFAVLGLLWAVLTVFKLVMVGRNPKPAEKSAAPASPVTPAASAAPAAPAAPVSGGLSEAELVAILAAAVAAYRASEGMDETEAGAFRVVSFRRASNGRAGNAR